MPTSWTDRLSLAVNTALFVLFAWSIWVYIDSPVLERSGKAVLVLAIIGILLAITTAINVVWREKLAEMVVFCAFAAMLLLWALDAGLLVYAQYWRPAHAIGQTDMERQALERDRMSKLAQFKALQAQTQKAAVAVFPYVFSQGVEGGVKDTAGLPLLPLSGLGHSATILCDECSRQVVYPSDRHGFNNPDNVWNSPATVLVAGDSYVHGNCVAPEENMISIMQREIGPTVNIGMGGNGPLSILASVVEYAPLVRPRHVVVAYPIGLLSRLSWEMTDPMLRSYLTPGFSQSLAQRSADKDQAISGFITSELAAIASGAQTSRDVIAQKDALAHQNAGTFYSQTPSAARMIADVASLFHLREKLKIGITRTTTELVQQRTLTAVFRRLHEEAAAWGGIVSVALLPDVQAEAPRNDPQRILVKNAAQAANIQIIDVTSALPVAPTQTYGCSHYNALGHNIVGRAIAARLLPRPQ